MTREQAAKIRKETTAAVTLILGCTDEQVLSAHEIRIANSLTNAYVRRNRGGMTDDDVRIITDAANEIFEAVRVRRIELRKGHTSLGSRR